MNEPTRQIIVMMHVPERIVGASVEEIAAVALHPENIKGLAAEIHRILAQPPMSLDLLIARLETERKAVERAAAPPRDVAWPARPTPHP